MLSRDSLLTQDSLAKLLLYTDCHGSIPAAFFQWARGTEECERELEWTSAMTSHFLTVSLKRESKVRGMAHHSQRTSVMALRRIRTARWILPRCSHCLCVNAASTKSFERLCGDEGDPTAVDRSSATKHSPFVAVIAIDAYGELLELIGEDKAHMREPDELPWKVHEDTLHFMHLPTYTVLSSTTTSFWVRSCLQLALFIAAVWKGMLYVAYILCEP
ncbi:hypothetical protein BJ170DRAFT_637793 [Xylariales sp. AK1849]|nr:hypothetical protein BJ170DRAFT_637793 [Xylariales sp. AK1849]